MENYATLFATVLTLVGPRPTGAPHDFQLKAGDALVAIGDSITADAGYLRDINTVLGRQYPDLKIKKVVNKGIGGQKSEDLLERFDRDVIQLKPAVVLISIGVNDVWHRLKKPHDEQILAAYKKNVAQMVDDAQRAGIRVILLTPTVIQEDMTAEGNRRLAAYVEAEKQIAAEKKCGLADLHGMFLAALAQKPADKQKWLTIDGVHMATLGNAIMAVGVLRALGVADEKIAATEAIAPPVRPATPRESVRKAEPAKAGN